MPNRNYSAGQHLIGSLPGSVRHDNADPSQYGSQDQYRQAANVRVLLEGLFNQGSAHKKAEHFQQNPDILTALARRFLKPENSERLLDANMLLQKKYESAAAQATPTPTPTPVPTPSSSFDYQSPLDIVKTLLNDQPTPLVTYKPGMRGAR